MNPSSSQNTHFRLGLSNDHAVQADGVALLNLEVLQRHLDLGHDGLHVAAREFRVARLVRKPPLHGHVARDGGLAGFVLCDDRVTPGILGERLRDDQTAPSTVHLYLKQRIPERASFNSSFSDRVALFRIRRVHDPAIINAASVASPRMEERREETRKRRCFRWKITSFCFFFLLLLL